MAERHTQAVLAITRCVRDAFYEHTGNQYSLCYHCYTNSRLIRANRYVHRYRVVLSTSVKVHTCTICSNVLITIAPALECDECQDAITDFFRTVTPSEAATISDTHLTDTISISIDRMHEYL